LRVGIYTRVSTDEQVEGFSLSAQQARCEALAVVKGWEAVQVYADLARSGKDLKRPKYEAMIKDLDTGLIQGVIVFKLDRLSRSLKDTYELIELFSTKKWALCSVSESLDITTPAGVMFVQILASFSQYERSLIKARMVEGFEEKRKQGGKIGGDEAGLFGYKRDEKGIIVIDEVEAQVIRKIFELRKEGKTQQVIADILKSEHAIQRKSKKGWTQVQVGRQLKLEDTYRGCAKAEIYGGFVFPKILK
jgi:site-specific DNA recombinase